MWSTTDTHGYIPNSCYIQKLCRNQINGLTKAYITKLFMYILLYQYVDLRTSVYFTTSLKYVLTWLFFPTFATNVRYYHPVDPIWSPFLDLNNGNLSFSENFLLHDGQNNSSNVTDILLNGYFKSCLLSIKHTWKRKIRNVNAK